MGAQSYDSKVIIKGNARDAFRQAREEANDYNGHREGYSGDIQTADGFSMRTDNPRFGTQAFYKWEEKQLDKMDKGDCICVELKGAVLKRAKGNGYWKGKKGVKGFYFFGMGRC
tara:strand:- start:1666 stop:2007 length:342 start_codon:yes stop_codon:yes gene_type:complete